MQTLETHIHKRSNTLLSQFFYSAAMALFLFAPNMITSAIAQEIPQLENDKSVGTYSDSVTFRETTISPNGTTETITTYEESYIYQDTVTRYIPEDAFNAQPSKSLATYGSFRVVNKNRAEMIGTTDSYSMERFNRMIAQHPNIKQIDMLDVAGTVDDEVNLELARKINAMGIATHIPKNGSVRSGGVELFLAGKRRSAHPSANFAVHSWRDEDGLEPNDFPKNHPVHRSYIDYYRDIAGMSEKQAADFYWMTNSAPHDDLIDLTTEDIQRYTPLN